jgi:hypothetical protein
MQLSKSRVDPVNPDIFPQRRVHFNFGRNGPPPREPANVRVAPYPAPRVLSEPLHDAERLVYESLLYDSPEIEGFAAYSLPLPYTKNRRLEIDFVTLTPFGVALIEVKGGLVKVDSRPGAGVRWAHYTRKGKPTGGDVKPTQLFRATETFSILAQSMAGVAFGRAIAQIMVFPHTSRSLIPPNTLAQLDVPNRDFMRIVFAEDLAQYGMWRLVEDEIRRPGRTRVLTDKEVTRLGSWIIGEQDVQPRDIDHAQLGDGGYSRPGYMPSDSLPTRSAPPSNGTIYYTPMPERSARDPLLELRPQRAPLPAIASVPRNEAPKAPPGPSTAKVAVGAVILVAASYLLFRPSTPPPPVSVPASTAAPISAFAPVAVPTRPVPTPDPFQAAISKAIAEPEKRVAAAGADWVRVLGPVIGRPGCQLVEMSRSAAVFNVIACRDSENGMWRY